MRKQEPKQETLEEANKNFYPPITTDLICSPKLVRDAFIAGAKWQAEQNKKLHNEEEVLPLIEMLQKCKEYFLLKTNSKSEERADAIADAIEQFKNK